MRPHPGQSKVNAEGANIDDLTLGPAGLGVKELLRSTLEVPRRVPSELGLQSYESLASTGK